MTRQSLVNFVKTITLVLFTGLLFVQCQRSPEKLPKYKKEFKAQIAKFENQKEKTDSKIEQGVVELTGIEKALAEAKNVDKEFNKVYGNWKRVDNNVQALYRDYEKLKEDADNLFGAMTEQTQSINDATSRNQLMTAINKIKGDYDINLKRTQVAVSKLQGLHSEAMDIIKGLEVAVALGQISEINSGLQGIESKVADIMTDLNQSIAESKALYDDKIGNF